MVFDGAAIGISTGNNGMLKETNAAFQQMVGYTGEELSRMHYREITHPDDAALDDDAMARLKPGENFVLEKRYVRKDGSTLWVRIVVSEARDGSFDIGLVEDITEHRRLLARTVEAAERERIAIAADLHDGPIQHLTATAFSLDLLVNQLTRNADAEAAADAAKIRDDVSAEMTSLRKMMVELRPPTIDEHGVVAAVRDTAGELFADTDTAVTVASSIDGRRFPPELETAIFRLTREALTNIRRHAYARNVLIQLDSPDRSITLTVTDDGTGFNPEAHTEGRYGLVNMQERAHSLGGTLTIISMPATGTRVHAAIPLP